MWCCSVKILTIILFRVAAEDRIAKLNEAMDGFCGQFGSIGFSQE
jgi:hypothetical protein